MQPRKLKPLYKRNGLIYTIFTCIVLLIYIFVSHIDAVILGCIGLICYACDKKDVQKSYLNYKKKVNIKKSIDSRIIPSINHLLDRALLWVFIDDACSILERNCINANSESQELINHSCINVITRLEKINKISKSENFLIELDKVKKSIKRLEQISETNQQIVDRQNCAFSFDKDFGFQIIEEARQLYKNGYDDFYSYIEGRSSYYDTRLLVKTLNKLKYEYLDSNDYIVKRIDFTIIALANCKYLSDIGCIIQDLKDDLLTKSNEDIADAEYELGNLLSK